MIKGTRDLVIGTLSSKVTIAPNLVIVGFVETVIQHFENVMWYNEKILLKKFAYRFQSLKITFENSTIKKVRMGQSFENSIIKKVRMGQS